MKIGSVTVPFTSARAQAPARDPSRASGRPRPRFGEMGATGTQIFGGLVSNVDYNNKFHAPKSYDEYDKMRNDGQVRAALTAVKLPLLNADWWVEPPTDKPKDREIAERLHKGLWEGMSTTFRTPLRQALLKLDYGSMPFEDVWELRDGFVMLRKLAPRLPRTVVEWQTDPEGGLKGIKQYASTSAGFQQVTIPVEKLLVFVNELEGSNWRGRSILRSAWKHYEYKDGLYRVQAIAIEKRGTGIDVGTLSEEDGATVDDDFKKESESVLSTIHAHEKNWLLEVPGFKYRIEGAGEGRVLDPSGAIEHHDIRILRSILAEFLGMGQGSTGSLAMHRDKSAFFMMAIGGVANEVADTFTRHLLRRWVDYNWVVDEYPRLRYSRLEVRDLQTWAEAVWKLVQSMALEPDDEVRHEVRSLLDLPPEKPGATGTESGKRKAENGDAEEVSAGDSPWREPQMNTDGTDVNGNKSQITESVSPVVRRQIAKLVEVGGNVWRRAAVEEALETIKKVSVPFKAAHAGELIAVGWDLDPAYNEARRHAERLKAEFIEKWKDQYMVNTKFDPVRLQAELEDFVSGRESVNV